MTSCSRREKVSGGTTPVPVSRTHPVRKPLRPKEVLCEAPKTSSDVAYRCFARKRLLVSAPDRDADRGLAHLFLRPPYENPRSECAGAIVNLGLRKVEEILAFDVARAHVVADREADNRSARVEHQRELWFRDVPAGISTNPYRIIGSDDLLRGSLEKYLGTFRVVYAVVRRRAEIRLFHASGFASKVCDAGSPHFLALDGRAEPHVRYRHTRQ